jgi:hypothetical protein
MSFHRIPSALAFFLLFSGVAVHAQSNERVDELLLQAQARFDSTAYIVLAAGGLIQETDGLDVAFAKAKELGWTGKSGTPEGLVRADTLSFMIMKSLGLKGGVMYSLFPGSRYAYRELVFRNAINARGGPSRLVTGEEVMRTLGYVSALKVGE